MGNIKIIVIFLLIHNLAYTQIDSIALKYSHYRTRLKRFVLVGLECDCKVYGGYSLPAQQRIYGTKEHERFIKWADDPEPLGWYMAMLATEHEILIRKGDLDSAHKTKIELYYAIKAFERLDLKAESQTWPTYINTVFKPHEKHCKPEDLNGFFMRNDVDDQFCIDNYRYFFPEFPVDSIPVRNVHYNTDFSVTFVNKYNGIVHGNNHMSQDHIVDVIFGFSFIKKYLTGYEYEHVDLGKLASSHAIRIIERIKRQNWMVTIPGTGDTTVLQPSPFKVGKLIVYNPFMKSTEKTVAMDAGYQAYILKTGFENALRYFKNEPVYPQYGSPVWSFVWQEFQKPKQLKKLPEFMVAFIQGLAAIGDSWVMPKNCYHCIGVHTKDKCYGLEGTHKSKIEKVNHTAIALRDNGLANHTEIYSLMNSLLHNKPAQITEEHSRKIAISAPFEGPEYKRYWNATDHGGTIGWLSSNRWMKNKQAYNPNAPGHDQGEFNGLDFMVFYNLYVLLYHQENVGSR